MSARNIKILVTILGALLSAAEVLAYRNAAAPAAATDPAQVLIMSNEACQLASTDQRR